MPTPTSPLERSNGILRAFGAPFRLRQHRRSRWVTIYRARAPWQKAVDRFGLQAEQVDGERVLELAIRSGCSSNNAEFVVLAEQLGCRLLTDDRKLLKLFPEPAVQPT